MANMAYTYLMTKQIKYQELKLKMVLYMIFHGIRVGKNLL